MRISLAGLRTLLPGLPEDPAACRGALDASGLEVKGIEETAADCYVSLEFLANRGDHRSYTGIAGELAARLGLSRTPLPVTILKTDPRPTRVDIVAPGCLGYTMTPLTVTDPHASLPQDTRARLEAAGPGTGLAVPDAARATCLESGHPVFVYDADRVDGRITIRHSRPGEDFTPAGDDRPRALPPGLLVVADQHGVLALAGVVESDSAQVTETSRNVLLECAAYDPVTVRRNASALGLSTTASQRFERGSDPATVLAGAGRAVRILESAGAAKPAGPTDRPVTWHQPLPTLSLTAESCSHFLGTDLSLDDIAARLADYGFAHQEPGTFRVPASRIWDVRETEDLYEEVARHIGYDDLPRAAMPPGPAAEPTREEVLLEQLGDTLVGLGFYETFTEGFYGKATLQLIAPPEGHVLDRHVHVQNSSDRKYALLKNNCLAQAVAALRDNERFKCHETRLFEATRTFIPTSHSPNGLCREQPVLWAMAQGAVDKHAWSGRSTPADFHYLRGAVEEMALRTHLIPEFLPLDRDHPLAHGLHPYRSAQISVAGRCVGVIGEVHPDVLHRAGLTGRRPCYLELDLEAWQDGTRPAVPGKPPVFHRSPAITRMLDFIVPLSTPSQEIERTLRTSAPSWLEGIVVSDVFAPPHLNANERSITYTLTFTSEPTRSTDEVNRVLEELVQAVTARFGAEGVRLR
ncbi:phenylalanine--tRNA ligase subunit beta [Streptomyces sp. IBSNAI002]|uniref:phenylalanine--tRNA ligase subunit beta n=1 Tax=Streptomyces sp. IBSNAI002 TaxID=3457500 RepID=UPI003FD18D88